MCFLCFNIILLLMITVVSSANSLKKFPESFKFGAGSSAFQIEGAWNVSDKGESILDHYIHNTINSSPDNGTADIACDSYHKYKDDIKIIKQLGLQKYRFSIAWTRILPNGFNNKISEDGKRYYNKLIDGLIDEGIEPFVNMYHNDLPHSLQKLGGWSNPLIVEWFEDYARVLFQLFGDRVKTWVTINEPAQICVFGYGLKLTAPAVDMQGTADYLCSKHVLLAHARAWKLYDEEYRTQFNGRIGITIHMFWYEPKTNNDEDIQAATDITIFFNDHYIHPIFSKHGDYPARLKEIVAHASFAEGYKKSRLPELTKDEIQLIKGSSDFFGLNHYGSRLVTRSKDVPEGLNFYLKDLGVLEIDNPAWKHGSSFWLQVNPKGFRNVIHRVCHRYNNPNILITESGVSTPPGLNDDDRVDYYRDHLSELLELIHENVCNITEFHAWTIMDNYEWMSGYTVRFGLFDVNFNDPHRTRTAKKSALVYKEIIRSRVIDYNYEPEGFREEYSGSISSGPAVWFIMSTIIGIIVL